MRINLGGSAAVLPLTALVLGRAFRRPFVKARRQRRRLFPRPGGQCQHPLGQGVWRHAPGSLERHSRRLGQEPPHRDCHGGPGRLTQESALEGISSFSRERGCQEIQKRRLSGALAQPANLESIEHRPVKTSRKQVFMVSGPSLQAVPE